MNKRHIFFLVLMIAVLAGITGTIYAIMLTHPRNPPQTPLEARFQGGVQVLFKEDVPVSRIDQITKSTGGIPILRDAQLHMVVLRFNPRLTLDQAVNLAKSLKELPEVSSAGPEINGLAN
jgi:hypothetical protein